MTDLLIPREQFPIQPVGMPCILERGNDESRLALPKFVHDDGAAQDRLAEVGAEVEINVEHHDEIRTGEQARDVAPGVELAIERVDDQVDVDVGRHARCGGVEPMEIIEKLLEMLGPVLDVHGYRNGSCVSSFSDPIT